MKYRKRPIVVEATQWFPGANIPGVYFDNYADRYYVMTIHGQNAYLDPGDWVITEPDGIHHYPCKPDIFDQTYERL
jgi:hypothetical protein